MHKTNLITSAALGVGALLLAACGGGGGGGGSEGASETTRDERAAEARAAAQASVEAKFCRGADQLYNQFQVGGQTSANGQEMFAAARALTAPDEIAADWETTLDALEPLVNPAATPEVDLQAAQETGVLDRVGNYINDTCKVVD